MKFDNHRSKSKSKDKKRKKKKRKKRNKIKKNRGPYARRGEIAAVSVKFMKGLESDIVAIVGIDGMNEAEKYVALTRSKNLIYLL